ncbi:MAG: phosphate/phosphite/phosphonate ABC transporter substrate-binding protein [Thiobacillaceae bacterium]
MPAISFRLFLLLLLPWLTPAWADGPLKFGVLNQHAMLTTAQIWNPILEAASRASGVPLVLAQGRSAPETTARTVAGDYDFAYTNHLFTPDRVKLGFRVIARLNRPPIEGQIVVPADSPLTRLTDLMGKTVVFPSREAFVGYHVPRQALDEAGIAVTERFSTNQEGAMQALRAGVADAASVNDELMRAFAARTGLRYRVLWTSDAFPDLAVMAHPRVPAEVVARVRHALLTLHETADGRAALAAANAILKNPEPLRFVPATDADYAAYRAFWQRQGVGR